MAAIDNTAGRAEDRRAKPRALAGVPAALAALALAAGAGACRDQQSFIVVTVTSVDVTPITGIVDFQVMVDDGISTSQLTYVVPADQSPLTITNAVDPKTGVVGKTFSVSFTIGHNGDVMFHVTARDAAHCTIGIGHNDQIIARGGVANIAVMLTHASGPCPNTDGGTDGVDVVFPGCDPATLSCSAPLTCAVNCAAMQGQCVTAGTAAPGGLCSQRGNADCAPGTQCFTYTGPLCSVPVCLKFCKTNSDCAAVGSGSVCQGTVACPTDGGSYTTAYHTCTFACDPRGTATSGCPAGLHCFVVDTMDQVDCSCTEATRTKIEGQACAFGADCAPGLICDQSTNKCQKVCKRSEGGTDCATGQSCTALTNDMTYGVCL
jgi:hypothetical protein